MNDDEDEDEDEDDGNDLQVALLDHNSLYPKRSDRGSGTRDLFTSGLKSGCKLNSFTSFPKKEYTQYSSLMSVMDAFPFCVYCCSCLCENVFL